MGKDYYHILGVGKNASQEEIKKAFRKKAHECHPDKIGGNEAKFKEINEAYQVLGDANKRSQYDQFGSAFEQARGQGGFSGFGDFRDFAGFTNGFSSAGGASFNLDDLGDIFGGLGDIFGFSGSRRQKRPRQGNDIQLIINIEFLEAVFGAEKDINFKKNVACSRCGGAGAEPDSKIITCKICGGSGQVNRTQRTIFGNLQARMACQECGGEGRIYEKKCGRCSGNGISQEAVNLKIKIPAGIDNNETIRISGQGEAGGKGAAGGDLYLKVRVNPDKRFIREGDEIISESEINITQAVLGGKIPIITVDGEVMLKIPEGTQSDTIFKLRGRGVPKIKARGRGDHLVKIIVKIPKNLNRKEKEILKELNI